MFQTPGQEGTGQRGQETVQETQGHHSTCRDKVHKEGKVKMICSTKMKYMDDTKEYLFLNRLCTT